MNRILKLQREPVARLINSDLFSFLIKVTEIRQKKEKCCTCVDGKATQLPVC